MLPKPRWQRWRLNRFLDVIITLFWLVDKPLSYFIHPLNAIKRVTPVIARWTIWIFPDDIAQRIDILNLVTIGVLLERPVEFLLEVVDLLLQLGVWLKSCLTGL